MKLDLIKLVAVRAAFRAGKILNQYYGKPIKITKKGIMDLVTEADVASEESIIATIHEVFPDHAILAEESGASGNGQNDLWVIDPLDGTTNFAHQLPIFAVSIAYCHNDEIMVGVVFNPATGELYDAVKDEGARLNGEPIQVTTTNSVGESLLVTGFPYTVRTRYPKDQMARFGRCLTAAQGIRRLGSAALDLCYVAAGRFDGYWEENLKPWDTAAGMCIVIEAGGKVSDFNGLLYTITDQQILATNSHIHRQMVDLLNTEGVI